LKSDQSHSTLIKDINHQSASNFQFSSGGRRLLVPFRSPKKETELPFHRLRTENCLLIDDYYP
jgi:hypothetical protein